MCFEKKKCSKEKRKKPFRVSKKKRKKEEERNPSSLKPFFCVKMKKKPVGYRFSPTGLELINHYLKNKILDKLWLVNDAINEINICAHDPKFLPGNFILSFST